VVKRDDTPPGDPHRSREEMGRTIRKLAHDLSNPLGVLRMASYFLKTTDDTKKRDRYLEMMDLNIDRIEQLLKDLRALTEAGPPADCRTATKDDKP
jgi:nitrogen-specific signal transduction histidine kinase